MDLLPGLILCKSCSVFCCLALNLTVYSKEPDVSFLVETASYLRTCVEQEIPWDMFNVPAASFPSHKDTAAAILS